MTNANVVEYVALYTEWLLNDSVAKQFAAFKRGFLKVCGGDALSLFRADEVRP